MSEGSEAESKIKSLANAGLAKLVIREGFKILWT